MAPLLLLLFLLAERRGLMQLMEALERHEGEGVPSIPPAVIKGGEKRGDNGSASGACDLPSSRSLSALMDAYEATRVVFSRIQALDPDNAAKIMGLLPIQDHDEKEMIRLAFGPESLLHSLVLKARKDLAASPFYGGGGGGGGGGGDLIDEFQLQDRLSFLNDTQSPNSMLLGSGGFLDECRRPGGGDDVMLQYGMGWPGHRRSCSVTDSCLGGGLAGFGWRPCLYFARGYCKNGSSCRFLHDLPDDVSAINTNKMDGTRNIEQQCHDALLLRSRSQHLANSQLMTSAAAFPYSPTSASMPPSPSSKCLSNG